MDAKVIGKVKVYPYTAKTGNISIRVERDVPAAERDETTKVVSVSASDLILAMRLADLSGNAAELVKAINVMIPVAAAENGARQKTK